MARSALVCVRLPEDLVTRVGAIATANQETVSTALRAIIRAGLPEVEGRGSGDTGARSSSLVDTARATPETVVATWNRIVTPPIPQAKKLTATRRAKLTQRIRTYPDLETWERVITWLNRQDWCRQGTGDFDTWKAKLDWLIRNDDVMARFLEEMGTPVLDRPRMAGSRTRHNEGNLARALDRIARRRGDEFD